MCVCLYPIWILRHSSLKRTVAFSNNAVHAVECVWSGPPCRCLCMCLCVCVCCVYTFITMHPSHPVLSAGSHLSAPDLPTSGQCMLCVFVCVCARTCVRRRWSCMRTVCPRAAGSRTGRLLALALAPSVAPWPTTHAINQMDNLHDVYYEISKL